jgi:DNA-directed RNA polymerase specialized sigma24 family protein
MPYGGRVRVDVARAVECHLVEVQRLLPRDAADVDLDPTADYELVQRVARRDPDAAEAFLDRVRCVPRILEALNRASGRPLQSHDLDDLGQHVLAEMLGKLGAFPRNGIVDRWAYHFCVYSFFNRVRKLRRTTASRLTAGNEPADGLAPRLELLDVGLMHAAVEALPADERALFVAKALDGVTFDELARRSATSANTLKTWYYAIVSRLRAKLAPQFDRAAGRARRRNAETDDTDDTEGRT